MTPETKQQRLEPRNSVFLCWAWRLLILLGILTVSYVGFMLFYAKYYQNIASTDLEMQMRAQGQKHVSSSGKVFKEGDVLGRIEIPRLGMMVDILEGTKSLTLNVGVGHIAGTALPGEHGNTGIAGHRDTYFRALKDIQMGDEIKIQTATGLSRYKVDRVKIVAPDDIGVLSPSDSSAITLVTCYPFYFIGASPRRFVVHAYQE